MPLLLVDAMVDDINGTARGPNACLARVERVLCMMIDVRDGQGRPASLLLDTTATQPRPVHSDPHERGQPATLSLKHSKQLKSSRLYVAYSELREKKCGHHK